MPWIKSGTLIKVNGQECLALEDSYSKRCIDPEDRDAFNAGIDMAYINDFCKVQPPEGPALVVNLHKSRIEVLF